MARQQRGREDSGAIVQVGTLTMVPGRARAEDEHPLPFSPATSTRKITLIHTNIFYVVEKPKTVITGGLGGQNRFEA